MRYLSSLILFVLLSNILTAQLPPNNFLQGPTKFDKFISDNEISWACYVIDTLDVPGQNLASTLLRRFEKDELKVTRPLTFERGKQKKIFYEPQAAIKKLLFPPGEVNFDSTIPLKSYPLDSSVVSIARILAIIPFYPCYF
ncbi:MAG: hypothetical protein ABIQ56_00540 [Chitinophagaceae bacterium]